MWLLSLSFILLSRNELTAVDSPQRKASLYRLTNVDRTHQFRFRDNAHHVSFYRHSSLTANSSCWSIWVCKCVNLTWCTFFPLILLFPNFLSCNSHIFILIPSSLACGPSQQSRFYSVVTSRLGTCSPSHAEGHCPIVGSERVSWDQYLGQVPNRRETSPITCLAPLYLLPWTFPLYQQKDHLNQAVSNVRTL